MGNDILMGLALWGVIAALAVMKGYQLQPAVLGSLVVAAVLLTLIVFLLPMPDEPRATPTSSAASYEHRLVVNPAGVQHHYFEGTRQPALDPSNPVPDVNRALQFLELPAVVSRPTETRPRHMTWDSYGEGRMTAHIGDCKRGGGTCIQRVMVTPGRRDMMRNQAEGRANQQFITADEFGREWPFTVAFGRVSCHGAGEVYFTTEDRTIYTVNGLARSARPNDPHVTAIWKDAPAGTPGGGKVSLHRVIQAGLALCR